MKKLIILFGVLAVSLTSCLKDKPTVDLSNIAPYAELVHSGKPFFSADAVTDAGDTVTKEFTINITGQFAPKSDVTVGIGVNNTLIAQFNSSALTYESAMPTDAFSLSATSVVVKAGNNNRLATVSVTFFKNKLDPSKSYMLPVTLTSASGGVLLSANLNTHFFHFIGNDFAGVYTWHYQRYNDGLGIAAPTTDVIHPDGVIAPISPTEFEMKTGYVSGEAKYDVTFTRTVDAADPTLIHYTNWKVIFNADNTNILVGEGLTTSVAPHFLVDPPATNKDPKIFKVNHTTGASSPRYIVDTYSK